MTYISLTTIIDAAIEVCFDVSRDIDIHTQSTVGTNERAVAGRTSGLCELGDTVTWEAKHFGIKQYLTVEIIAFNKPYFFEDKMLKGTFKSMQHQHIFENQNGKTIVTDKFQYETPFGIFGKLFDYLILKKYMTKFLIQRNNVLKEVAEGIKKVV